MRRKAHQTIDAATSARAPCAEPCGRAGRRATLRRRAMRLRGLVRGEAIDDAHIRRITCEIAEMKKVLLKQRFALPYFVPFVMRTMLAANALLAALGAPESGPLGRLPGAAHV